MWFYLVKYPYIVVTNAYRKVYFIVNLLIWLKIKINSRIHWKTAVFFFYNIMILDNHPSTLGNLASDSASCSSVGILFCISPSLNLA